MRAMTNMTGTCKTERMTIMKDRAGNNLVAGDSVLYLQNGRSTSWLVWGIVEGFTPKMVTIRDANQFDLIVRRNPSAVVKPFKES